MYFKRRQRKYIHLVMDHPGSPTMCIVDSSRNAWRVLWPAPHHPNGSVYERLRNHFWIRNSLTHESLVWHSDYRVSFNELPRDKSCDGAVAKAPYPGAERFSARLENSGARQPKMRGRGTAFYVGRVECPRLVFFSLQQEIVSQLSS